MTNRSGIVSLALALSAIGAAGCIAAPAESEAIDSNRAAVTDGVAETATVVSWDAETQILIVINPALSTERLVANAGTIRGFEDPNELPAGPCRSVSLEWNMFVFQGRSADWFSRLLAEQARLSCHIDLERNGAPNADGSFDLISLRPAP